MAVDGSNLTHWLSRFNEEFTTVTLNLGRSTTVSEITVRWKHAPKSFTMQILLDSNIWVTVA